MIKYAFYDFEFGILKIGYTETAVVSIARVNQPGIGSEPSKLTELVFKELCEYLKGQRSAFDFPYELHGTDFQKKVWQSLCQIPYGETRSYKQLAEAIGSPKASRAVGAANGKNPIMIIVPCHRVIGNNGSLTGYAGGLDMKQRLLALEQNKTI